MHLVLKKELELHKGRFINYGSQGSKESMGGITKFYYQFLGGIIKLQVACKIPFPFNMGDRKINETNFAQFFRPPAPVVNEPPLIN